MFVLIGVMFPLGYVMINMPLSPQKLQVYSWHKSIGMVILLLAILRLGWRLISPPPPLSEAATYRERLAAHVVHGLLYVCLFALPISGWLMSSAAGLPVAVFGLWQMPNIISPNEANRLLLLVIHKSVGFSLLTFLCAHVAASLYHHYARKDDTLVRMLPFKIRKGTGS